VVSYTSGTGSKARNIRIFEFRRAFNSSFSPRCAFRSCGWLGVAIGLPLALLAAAHLDLSLAVVIIAAVVGILTLLGTGMAAKILSGNETFVYFRDIPAIFAAAACTVWLARRPVLPYMNCVVLGATAFLACGRIGCLLVGCCHGRPSRFGICYGPEHAEYGFPGSYVGVRLFPIQAVESLFVLCLAGIETALFWHGAAPGCVLAFYFAAYPLGRFFLEFGRGDSTRPYLAGFSEAQWTSVLLATVLVLTERLAILPRSAWHGFMPIFLAFSMLVVAAWRRLDSARLFEMLHPHHMDELISALDHLAVTLPRSIDSSTGQPELPQLRIAETSLGYRISSGEVASTTESPIAHYSLSHTDRSLSRAALVALSRAIANLKHGSCPFRIIQGRSGVSHVFLERGSPWNTERCVPRSREPSTVPR